MSANDKDDDVVCQYVSVCVCKCCRDKQWTMGPFVAICAVNAGRGHRYELQSDQIKHGSKKRHRGMRIREYGQGSKTV